MTTFATSARVTPRAAGATGAGEERDAEIFARDGRLYVDGARIPLVYAYATDRIAALDEPNTVRVVGDGLTTLLDVALPETRAAEELLVALEVDALARPVSLRAGRVGIDPMLFMLVPLIAIVPAVLVALWLGVFLVFYVVLAVVVVVLVFGARRPKTVSLDASGLTIRGGVLGNLVIPWTRIVEVERNGDGLRLRLRDAKPSAAEPDAYDLLGLDPAGREGLYFMLVRRRMLANRAAEVPPPSEDGAQPVPPKPAATREAPAVPRVPIHDGAAWLDVLAASVPRGASPSGYRDASPNDDDLRAAARDVDLDPALRVASAVLLARAGVRPPRVHLRDDADPRLRALVADVVDALDAGRDLTVAVEAVRRFLSPGA